MLINWSPALSVQIKRFDEQHVRLVQMLNDLHAAMGEGKGNEVLGKTLDGLIQYTATHFADEEQLMKAHGYAGLTKHRAEHEKLVAQVLDLQAKFKAGKGGLTLQVMHFLKDWLVNHIQGEDQAYGKFFAAKGIQG
jgi:hemerythrin